MSDNKRTGAVQAMILGTPTFGFHGDKFYIDLLVQTSAPQKLANLRVTLTKPHELKMATHAARELLSAFNIDASAALWDGRPCQVILDETQPVDGLNARVTAIADCGRDEWFDLAELAETLRCADPSVGRG
jgi:hypothetical protein